MHVIILGILPKPYLIYNICVVYLQYYIFYIPVYDGIGSHAFVGVDAGGGGLRLCFSVLNNTGYYSCIHCNAER